MKLSIITINYNNCIGLERTLHSIMTQTCRDFEWIVIDGGSTDGSRELIERHQGLMTYWCSEPDRGIYHAMNKGVANTKGEYCLFLNSGDELCDSNVIERLRNIAFSADIVSCDIYIDGIGRNKLRKSVDNVNAYWIYDNSLYHPSTWIRRSILVECPYHEEYRTISDWVFFFEAFVLHDCTYQHISFPISVFYKDGLSCNQKYRDMAVADKFNFLKKLFPVKYIDDKEDLTSFYYISLQTGRMTKAGQLIMRFLYRTIAYIDLKVFKPLDHLF